MKNYASRLNVIPQIEGPYCNITNKAILYILSDSKTDTKSLIEISDEILKIIDEIQKEGDFFKYLKDANSINETKRGDGTFIGTFNTASDDFKNFGIVLPKGGMIIPEINNNIIINLLKEIKENKNKLVEQINDTTNQIIKSYNQNLSTELSVFGDVYIKLNGIIIFEKPCKKLMDFIGIVNDFIEYDKSISKCRRKNIDIISSMIEEGGSKYYINNNYKHIFDFSTKIEFEGNIYKWLDEDMKKLKIDIDLFFKKRQEHLDYIFKLYKNSGCNFEKESYSAYGETSMVNGKARRDDYINILLIGEDGSSIKIDEDNINEVEYLRGRLGELENEDGCFRNLYNGNQEKVPELLNIKEKVIIYGPQSNRSRGEYDIHQLYNGDIIDAPIYTTSGRREGFFYGEYNGKKIDSLIGINKIIKCVKSFSNSFKVALKSTYPTFSIHDAYSKYLYDKNNKFEDNMGGYIEGLEKYINKNNNK